MNDFDRQLEIGLKRLLDPVVARRPPARRGRSRTVGEAAPTPIAAGGAAEVIPVVAPAALPAASARSL